ncbi:AbrB/MazE/SpoVT family DNA-binding domain-containing protein [Henriciella sp.]|uniref:AbrB/MazE/SpoVT family DNA-binding domain-containing protein n=1 Tax=Henriciella sp. TaxID=1968823 RepID=UPI00263435BF|nr:AbrB/MazE/SpoVT family DNA-binding domain-containing protein [Henriciella sp.]
MTDRKTDKGMKEAGAAPLTPPVSASMKVRKIGNSLGVILPRDILNALGVEEGDTVDVVQTHDGRIELAVVDHEADDLMSMAEEIMAENRAVLRALAK